MATRKRSYNLRLIKMTWPYTVQEISELFDVHKNAVLRWIKAGLKPNPGKKPFLIRGNELFRFLDARKTSKRRKCAEAEFFCFKCRFPREAYLGIADVVIETMTRLRVKALCASCGTNVNKTQNTRDIPRIRNLFNVQELTGEHLLERVVPSLNSDLER